MITAQSAWAVEYTNNISAEEENPSPNECPGYDTKASDVETPVMQKLWEMQSTSSLPLLQGPLRPIYASNRTFWYLNWVQANDLC